MISISEAVFTEAVEFTLPVCFRVTLTLMESGVAVKATLPRPLTHSSGRPALHFPLFCLFCEGSSHENFFKTKLHLFDF